MGIDRRISRDEYGLEPRGRGIFDSGRYLCGGDVGTDDVLIIYVGIVDPRAYGEALFLQLLPVLCGQFVVELRVLEK